MMIENIWAEISLRPSFNNYFLVAPLNETDPNFENALKYDGIPFKAICMTEQMYREKREAQLQIPIYNEMGKDYSKAKTLYESNKWENYMLVGTIGVVVGIIVYAIVKDKIISTKNGFNTISFNISY